MRRCCCAVHRARRLRVDAAAEARLARAPAASTTTSGARSPVARPRASRAELERFRAAAEFIWGRKIPAAPVRTRVFAFDDRGVGRRVRVWLRARLPAAAPARRRDRAAHRRRMGRRRVDGAQARVRAAPVLECEPGRRCRRGSRRGCRSSRARSRAAATAWSSARCAATTSASCATASGSHSSGCSAASDLVGWSSLEREMFEAESWALCHYLVLSESRRGRSQCCARTVPQSARRRRARPWRRRAQRSATRTRSSGRSRSTYARRRSPSCRSRCPRRVRRG